MVCEHAQVELRVKTAVSGAKMYGYQCLRCGSSVGSWIAKSAALWESQETGKPIGQWDDGLRTEFWQRVTEARKEEREQQSEEWWERYTAYLESAEWRSKRERVLGRDGHICQACLKRRATQVHHLTYKHVFNEPLFELVSVCEVCHDAITEMDRQVNFSKGQV